MGKYIYICINVYTHSLDPHITGLRYPVYPVTAPGSPTGRHTHARMHKQVSGSLSKDWHRSNLTVVLQGFVEEGLCPRVLATCCSLEEMVEAWMFSSIWDCTQSEHCNPGQCSAVIQLQGRHSLRGLGWLSHNN